MPTEGVCWVWGRPEREGERVGSSQVVERPPVEPVVVEAHCDAVVCPPCGHRTGADYPEGLEPERVFGAQVEGLVSYFQQVPHRSYARLQEVLWDVLGLEISVGALVNSVPRVAQELEKPAEEVRDTLRGSAVLGSDETGRGWTGGTNGSGCLPPPRSVTMLRNERCATRWCIARSAGGRSEWGAAA